MTELDKASIYDALPPRAKKRAIEREAFQRQVRILKESDEWREANKSDLFREMGYRVGTGFKSLTPAFISSGRYHWRLLMGLLKALGLEPVDELKERFADYK